MTLAASLVSWDLRYWNSWTASRTLSLSTAALKLSIKFCHCRISPEKRVQVSFGRFTLLGRLGVGSWVESGNRDRMMMFPEEHWCGAVPSQSLRYSLWCWLCNRVPRWWCPRSCRQRLHRSIGRLRCAGEPAPPWCPRLCRSVGSCLQGWSLTCWQWPRLS